MSEMDTGDKISAPSSLEISKEKVLTHILDIFQEFRAATLKPGGDTTQAQWWLGVHYKAMVFLATIEEEILINSWSLKSQRPDAAAYIDAIVKKSIPNPGGVVLMENQAQNQAGQKRLSSDAEPVARAGDSSQGQLNIPDRDIQHQKKQCTSPHVSSTHVSAFEPWGHSEAMRRRSVLEESVWAKLQALKEKYLGDAEELIVMLTERSNMPMAPEQLEEVKHYEAGLQYIIRYLTAPRELIALRDSNQDNVDAIEQDLLKIMERFKGTRERPTVWTRPEQPVLNSSSDVQIFHSTYTEAPMMAMDIYDTPQQNREMGPGEMNSTRPQ